MNKIKDLAVALGLLLMLVMAALPLLGIVKEWMTWAYAAGAAMVLVARLFQRYEGNDLRARRLHHMLTVSALMYCGSAALTFYSQGTGDWIALLLAGALMQSYATWMIEKIEKKNVKK